MTSMKASSEFLTHQFKTLGILTLLESEGVTEICINSPGTVFAETRNGWRAFDVPSLTFERARHFCISVVNESNTGQRITDQEPMASITLPNGARAQLVMPPACDRSGCTIARPPAASTGLNSAREYMRSPAASGMDVASANGR